MNIRGEFMYQGNRNYVIKFKVTDEEKKFIIQKAKLAECPSTSAYIRKMAITGVIVKYENQDIKKLIKSLSGIQRNINQMAMRVNATNRIYDDDFDYMKEVLNDIWHTLTSIQSILLSLQQ